MNLSVFDPMVIIGLTLAVVFLIPVWRILGGRRLTQWILAALYAFNVVFMAGVVLRVYGQPEGVIVKIGGFEPPFGIVLHVTLFGATLALMVWVLALLSLVYSWNRELDPADVYYALMTLLALGATGMLLTGDIFNLFVFTEITALAAFGLAAFLKKPETSVATIRYIIMAEVASVMLLVAIAILYGKLGTLNMLDAKDTLGKIGMSGAMILSLLFFLIGYGVESEIFPLNLWAPDVYASAPAEVVALFIGGSSKAAAFAWLRMWGEVFGYPQAFKIALLVVGLTTFAVAELMALSQNRVRRTLGYASLGQMGLVFVAFSLGTKFGLIAAFLIMLNHILAEAMLFYTVGISEEGGSGWIRIPVVLGFAGAIALPPFVGFWGKLLLFYALALEGQWIAIGIIALFSIVEIAYMYRWFVRLWNGPEVSFDNRAVAPGVLSLLSVVAWLIPFIPVALEFANRLVVPFVAKGGM